MHELNVIVPRQRIPDLSERQIEALRKAMPAFDISWKSVEASDRHAAELRAKMGVQQ
jgi:hypothetical protein